MQDFIDFALILNEDVTNEIVSIEVDDVQVPDQLGVCQDLCDNLIVVTDEDEQSILCRELSFDGCGLRTTAPDPTV